MISNILQEAKRFAKKDIQPVIVLAYGLMLRDITAAIATQAGQPLDPPFVGQSILDLSDVEAIETALGEYLEWSGREDTGSSKRQPKRTAKAEGKEGN